VAWSRPAVRRVRAGVERRADPPPGVPGVPPTGAAPRV